MTRRFSAALLAMVFSFGLIAPLLSDPANALPACCRRKGKHGCHGKGDHDGPAVQTQRCAQFPDAQTLPSQSLATVAAVTRATFDLVAVEPVVTTAFTPRPASFERAHSERGPPSPLA